MSARDDAKSEHAHRGHRGLTLVLATLAGAAIGAVISLLAAPLDQPLFEVRTAWSGGAPTAGEWPREPRAGEDARVEPAAAGTQLVVVAPRAPLASALAGGLLARRDADVQSLLRTRAALELDWRVHMRVAPGAVPSPRIECAALLLARAHQQHDLVASSPAAWGRSGLPLPEPPEALVAARDRVASTLVQGEPGVVLDALVAQAAAEDSWFAGGVPDRHTPFLQRAALWREWQLASAGAFDALALSSIPSAKAALDSALSARELALARVAVRTSPPFDGLLRSIVSGPGPVASPLAQAWAEWLGFGALLGALGALLTAFLGLAMRGARLAPRPLFVPAREPGARTSWLHVISGPNPAAVARAAIELSAHVLARGERVLVVDGGPRLKLHERFEREARWGLMECLVADMPIVGLVQYGGRPGFYLLAHGVAGRREGWAALGQRLDDARPHFGRVVLALDPAAPRAVGDSLLGRALEGWWAAPIEKLPRAAQELSDRLGIALSGIDLGAVSEANLEALAARAGELTALPGMAVEIATEAPALPLPVALPIVAPEPVVLDCDLQVRQRLRFLAWMRRVQSERRRTEAASRAAVPVAVQN